MGWGKLRLWPHEAEQDSCCERRYKVSPPRARLTHPQPCSWHQNSGFGSLPTIQNSWACRAREQFTWLLEGRPLLQHPVPTPLCSMQPGAGPPLAPRQHPGAQTVTDTSGSWGQAGPLGRGRVELVATGQKRLATTTYHELERASGLRIQTEGSKISGLLNSGKGHRTD